MNSYVLFYFHVYILNVNRHILFVYSYNLDIFANLSLCHLLPRRLICRTSLQAANKKDDMKLF